MNFWYSLAGLASAAASRARRSCSASAGFSCRSPRQVPRRVDAARVALELAARTPRTPHVLEVDVVRVLGRDLDPPTAERARALRRPRLELAARAGCRDAVDHEVGEVAELVRRDVEQTVLVVDDLLGQLDGGVVLDSGGGGGGAGSAASLPSGCCGCGSSRASSWRGRRWC